MGLYLDYKRRNRALDALSPPRYLAESKTPLRNQKFKDLDNLDVLQELHHFLFVKHNLLDRVVRARQLHHSRFYSLNLDYGHKAYIDKLTNERFVVLQSLERVDRRIAEVLYEQSNWFKWVRERQDNEEAAREKESQKIKKEAKMFRRHWKEVQARLREKRKAEDQRRQDTYLDQVYRERIAQMSEEGRRHGVRSDK